MKLGDEQVHAWAGGLTKREYFIAAALTGLSTLEHLDDEVVISLAVQYADQILEKLESEKK